jgi:Flp pilus assembly protein TadD
MIPEEKLSAYLDDALDAGQRQSVEVELEHDASALRLVLEQRQLDRVLRSLLGAASRRERLKESILAALAGAGAEQLRAQVLADTSGAALRGSPANTNTEAPPAPALTERPSTASAKWSEPRAFIRTWIDDLLGNVRASATARFAVAASLVLLGALTWFITVSPRPAARAEVGVLAQVVGYPELHRLGEDSAFGAQVGTPMRMGDRLETGDADRAEIRFRDGTTLRLGFNTVVDLRAADVQRSTFNVQRSTSNAELPTPNSPFTRPSEIHLLQGQIWTKVQTLTNAPEYAIRTDVATAVARGTEFGVKLQRVAPNASIPNPQSPTGSQKSEVGSQKSETSNPQRSTSNPGGSDFLAVLTVKEGTVDFFNSFGSVQATAMTESTASADSAPTEPRRLQTLQVVQLDDSTTWSLTTMPLDWSEAAERLVGGAGSIGWQLRDVPAAADASDPSLRSDSVEVRVSQVASSSPTAEAGLRLGDTLLTIDGQSITNARQVHSSVLMRPGERVTLGARGPDGEREVALTARRGTNLLAGPTLSAASIDQLGALVHRWIATPFEVPPDATEEQRRLAEAAGSSRELRAAAFNNLGVIFELDDALGSAVRAYGRAVFVNPQVPLFRFNLASTLRKIGSFERAFEEFEAADRLEPGSVAVRLSLADIYSLLGRDGDALAAAEALLELAPGDSGAWQLKSQLLSKAKRPTEAREAARRAVELDPDDPIAHAYLGEAFHAGGQFAEAEAAYAEALELAPFDAVFHLNFGTLQRDLGQQGPAEQSFRRAVALRPDWALAYRNLGEILAERRDFVQASTAFQQAKELDPRDAIAHWRWGDMALKLRQFDAAAQAYRAALEVAPSDHQAWFGLGETHRLLHRSTEAEAAYRKAIELKPDYAAAHTALGIMFYDRGQVDEAEALYRRAIELNPAESAPYNNLGNVYREGRGDPEEAEKWYLRALELSPNDAEPRNGLGLTALERGQLAEAERLLRHALELDPDSPVINNNVGEVLRLRGRLDDAERFYRKALELDPDYIGPYGNLGILHAMRGQFDEAERMFRALLERTSGGARLPVLVNLASVCADLGKVDEAEALYRQALELSPNHPRVASSLAHFLADHSLKLDEALTLAARAVQAVPHDTEFLDTLGWVQAQRGELDEAERTLLKALDLAGEEPPAPEIREHLQLVRARKRTE